MSPRRVSRGASGVLNSFGDKATRWNRKSIDDGTFDNMFKTLTDQLAKGPYLLGERFSAADVLWGTALTWTTMFGLAPETPITRAYMDRINARPAVAKTRKLDAELAAAQENAG